MKYRHAIFAFLIGVFSAETYAATIDYIDGDFDSPAWLTSTISGADAGQNAAVETAGGDPGNFFSVTTNTNANTSTAHVNSDFVYDPSMGAINSLDVSIDYRNIFSFGQGHGVGAILAMQGGNVFVAGNFITSSAIFAWQNESFDDLVAADFGLRVGAGILDLTTSGSLITFGFETRNSGGNGINVGYDNFALTLNTTPVPVPAVLPLFSIILASMVWRTHEAA